MAGNGRCTGGAAVALVGMCLGLTGCVQTETAFQPLQQPMNTGTANYQQPRAQSPSGPSSLAMPGANPGGEVVQTVYRPLGARGGLQQVGGFQPVDAAPIEDVPLQGQGPGTFPPPLPPLSPPPPTVP